VLVTLKFSLSLLDLFVVIFAFAFAFLVGVFFRRHVFVCLLFFFLMFLIRPMSLLNSSMTVVEP
jgi:hypothetical protein